MIKKFNLNQGEFLDDSPILEFLDRKLTGCDKVPTKRALPRMIKNWTVTIIIEDRDDKREPIALESDRKQEEMILA